MKTIVVFASIWVLTLPSFSAQDKGAKSHQEHQKQGTMKNDIISEVVGTSNAPVIILFGGNPYRRDEVVRLLSELGDITIYGTLGEEEGMAKIEELNRKVNLVLIGGRYTDQQRTRIKKWVSENLTGVDVTQPGYDYPYSNPAIFADVKAKLGL